MIKSSTVESALQLLYRRTGIVLWSILHDRGIISQIPLEVNKSFVMNCIFLAFHILNPLLVFPVVPGRIIRRRTYPTSSTTVIIWRSS
jgi:hypothetical protein